MASSNSNRPTGGSNGAVQYSNLDWALAYQRTGLVLLPLWPGIKGPHASKKHPERAVLGSGFRLAEVGECSEAWVQRCWSAGGGVGANPANGIGVVCGSRSRLLIVDVDVKHSGEFAWEAWRVEREAAGYELPQGPLVRTPSGGYHLWFRLPEGLELKSWDGWLPGVDVLADGHWAAVPPTFVRDSGKLYEFLRSGQTPEAPEWFIEQVSGRGRSSRPTWATGGGVGSGDRERFDWVAALTNSIQPGEQQVTLFRAASSARARGWDDEKALTQLRRLVGNFIEDPSRDPWTDEVVIETWERVKREYEDGHGDEPLEEVEVPEYTPWSVGEGGETEVEVRVDVTNAEARPQLRIIQGGATDGEPEVSEPEAPTGGDGDSGGAGLGGPSGDAPFSLENNDRTNAEEFIRGYGHRTFWLATSIDGWHTWSGTHWVESDQEVRHLWHEFTDDIGRRIRVADALGDPNEEVDRLARRYGDMKKLSNQKRGLEHAQDYAKRDPETVDADPHLLTFPNGSLDLRDLALRPHDPADLNTRITRTPLTVNARSALLDRWRETFIPNDGHWEAMWRLMGSCLLGDNRFRQVVFLTGHTTSGKSQIAELFEQTLGGFGMTVSGPSIFRGNLDDRPRVDLLNPMNKRVVFIEESSEQWELHADRVKAVTSGGKLSARRMVSNTYVEKRIGFTVVIPTNELPPIVGVDKATLRRIKVVPFPLSLSEEREDPAIRLAMLEDEDTLEAVLWEAVSGCHRALQRGVNDLPTSFIEARDEAYGELMDVDDLESLMRRMIESGLLRHTSVPSHGVALADIMMIFKAVCSDSPLLKDKRPVAALGKKIRLLGYDVRKIMGSRLTQLELTQDPISVIAQLIMAPKKQ